MVIDQFPKRVPETTLPDPSEGLKTGSPASRRPAGIQDLGIDLLFGAGMLAFLAGIWALSPPAAAIVGGLIFMALAVLAEGRKARGGPA